MTNSNGSFEFIDFKLKYLHFLCIFADPYVKVLLTFGNGKKSKKKKTSTKHNVLTPVWNEALTFNLPKDCLQTASLDFLVCHDNKLGNDEILGRTRISADSTGDERLHWDEMINGRSAVARWHNLSGPWSLELATASSFFLNTCDDLGKLRFPTECISVLFVSYIECELWTTRNYLKRLKY